MKMKKLGNTGIKISEMTLGSMSFGRWIDEKTSLDIIDFALESGINHIDTANMYGRGQDTGDYSQLGEAEIIVGKALKGRRDKVILATKVFNPMGLDINERGLSRRHIMKAVEDSLRRLQTDYIDIYYAHRPDPETPFEETLRAFDDLIRQGKVRYIACSNFQAWQIAKCHGISDLKNLARFEVVQPQYSLLVRDIENELLPFCRSENVGVIVYSPLARGMLSGKYTSANEFPEHSRAKAGEQRLLDLMTQRNFEKVESLRRISEESGIAMAKLAIAWVLHQPGITSAIVGSTRKEQLQELVEAASLTLDEELLRQLDEATR